MYKSECLRAFIVTALLTQCLATHAGDVPESEYGPDDTLGAVNRLTPEGVIKAAKLVTTGKTYALGVETGPDSPAYPPRKYQMTILQLDDGVGRPAGSNKVTGNDDLMYTYLGIGSQIDGLGHVGIDLSAFAPDGFAMSGTVLDPVMTTTWSQTAGGAPAS